MASSQNAHRQPLAPPIAVVMDPTSRGLRAVAVPAPMAIAALMRPRRLIG